MGFSVSIMIPPLTSSCNTSHRSHVVVFRGTRINSGLAIFVHVNYQYHFIPVKVINSKFMIKFVTFVSWLYNISKFF